MEYIGAGATSMVFKTHRATVMKQPLLEHEDEIDSEYKVYNHLGHHPRIARCLGRIGHALELTYYERGFMENELSTQEPDFPTLLKWLEQILEALVFIHSKNVIHCDLRPANILVTDDDDIVLIDFGAASWNGKKISNVNNNFKYLIPSYWDSNYQTTIQEDTFAMGTVIYRLITNSAPFPEDASNVVHSRYRKLDFPDVSALETGPIIDRCWRGGYSNTTEILNDIRHLRSKNAPKITIARFRSHFSIRGLAAYGYFSLKITGFLLFIPTMAILTTRYLRTS